MYSKSKRFVPTTFKYIRILTNDPTIELPTAANTRIDAVRMRRRRLRSCRRRLRRMLRVMDATQMAIDHRQRNDQPTDHLPSLHHPTVSDELLQHPLLIQWLCRVHRSIAPTEQQAVTDRKIDHHD